MRNLLRLGLVAAVAAVVVPTGNANAIYCEEPLTEACYTLCEGYWELGRPCPR